MDGYQEFLLGIRRDINCLVDNDRRTRQNALGRLQKALSPSGGGKAQPEFVRRLFLEELHKPLFRMFADATEKCREQSIALTMELVDVVPAGDLDNVLPLLLAALRGRVWTIPFPEQSEELRLECLRLLSHLFDICKDGLNPFASDILDMLSKAVTDSCPDAKKECCEITKKVSLHFDAERTSRAGGPLVAALLANLRHQQWKVRRATLDCLGHLLSLEATMLEHMEEVLPHLGALVGDRTPGVRVCLAEGLERWLLKGIGFREPTQISFEDDDGPLGFEKFEHRLVLLLLGCASDEDTEQVAALALGGLERAAALKHEVRKKRAEAARAKEQARGLPQSTGDPEVAPDFDYAAAGSLLPEPFTSGRAPSALTTTYIQLHLSRVLPQVLGNLTQWTSDIRIGAARQLRIILVLANRQIAPFLDQVLVHLYKAAADDEATVARAIMQCAEMAGTFVDADLVLALVAKHLGIKPEGGAEGAAANGGAGVDELWPEARYGRAVTRTVQDVSHAVKSFTATSLENKRQVYMVLAHLLRPQSPADAKATLGIADVRSVVRLLEEGASSDELLPWILGATQALLRAGGEECRLEWPRLFDMLLRMRSGVECDEAKVDAGMDTLAAICGRTRRQLYEEHLQVRMGELLLGADRQLWDERSAKRHVLETLVRNSGAAVASHLGALLPVLARQVFPEDAAAPARIDLLGVVHFLVTSEDPSVLAAVKEQAAGLLETVLIPNCTWRAGQANNKIRKGGMVCVHALLQRHLLEPAALNASFADLLPILKSCLDDSWSPDNRMIACLVMTCTLAELQADINGEQLREVYPELLKRLDDSNDKIRAAVCDSLATFFKCLPPGWSHSLYEYIVRTLFVHLDDPNPEIQQGIYGVLEAAAHHDYGTFVREAQAAGAKSSHPRLCEELARLGESLRLASPDANAEGEMR